MKLEIYNIDLIFKKGFFDSLFGEKKPTIVSVFNNFFGDKNGDKICRNYEILNEKGELKFNLKKYKI